MPETNESTRDLRDLPGDIIADALRLRRRHLADLEVELGRAQHGVVSLEGQVAVMQAEIDVLEGFLSVPKMPKTASMFIPRHGDK